MGAITVRIKTPFALLTRPVLERAWKRALTAAAQAAISIISERTARGVDVHGRPFRPYTTRYRLLKTATGRSGRPDLTLTGEMLRRLRFLRYDPTTRSAWIGFEGQHRVTRFGRASRRGFVSDRATQRTLGKRTLKRTSVEGEAGSVPIAKVVLGNDRLRPFFAVVAKHEIREIVAVAQRAFDDEIRKATSGG